jgi:signal peptidase
MKKETYIITVIEVLLLIISLFQIYVVKSFSYPIYLLILFVILGISYYFLKFDKRKERLSKDVLLIIGIVVLLYWLIIYIVGYFSGFLMNSYQRSFFGITKNILYAFGLISSSEIMRHMFLRRRNDNTKLFILSIIVFSFVEIVTKFSANQLDSNVQILKLLFSVVVPIFSKNILLSFITLKVGCVSSILYRSLIELPLYVVPIIPNLGYYIENLIITILPLIILLIIYKLYYSDDGKIVSSRMYNKINKISNVIYSFIVIILLGVVILVSGIGRYIVYTIGSASMEPTIDVGDVVVIDKKDKDFEEDDIIAFYHNDVILVHRVVKVYKDAYGKYYQTKGDNNATADSWLVKEKDVVGQYKMRFRWIGWPTVKLNEWLIGGE